MKGIQMSRIVIMRRNIVMWGKYVREEIIEKRQYDDKSKWKTYTYAAEVDTGVKTLTYLLKPIFSKIRHSLLGVV